MAYFFRYRKLKNDWSKPTKKIDLMNGNLNVVLENLKSMKAVKKQIKNRLI